MARIFQIQTRRGGETFFGKNLTTSVNTIYPGLLVVLDAGGRTVSLAGATGSAPLGVGWGGRYLNYGPTSKTFSTGEPITAVTGHFFAQVSAEYFSSGSLPTEDVPAPQASIYAAASGKLDITGTLKVGRLIDTDEYVLPTGGTGTTQSTVLIEFNFNASA